MRGRTAGLALIVLSLATQFPPRPSLAARDTVASEKGFSVRQVLAEAGVHPEAPSPTAERALTDQGHAYWVQPQPILRGGIVGVGMSKGLDGWGVSLRVNEDAAKQMEKLHVCSSRPRDRLDAGRSDHW